MAANYFSHDSNARNDEKVIRLRMKHGAAGYGVYFMLLGPSISISSCAPAAILRS